MAMCYLPNLKGQESLNSDFLPFLVKCSILCLSAKLKLLLSDTAPSLPISCKIVTVNTQTRVAYCHSVEELNIY